MDDAIYIAIGGNLSSVRFETPLAACEAALTALERVGICIAARSRWYRSAPVPASAQPWFCNGVARVETRLAPTALLRALHEIEADFGRARGVANAPRVIDLDLIAYGARVSAPGATPILPHPRAHARAFVLRPLAELDSGWRHPALGLSMDALLAALPVDGACAPLEGSAWPGAN